MPPLPKEEAITLVIMQYEKERRVPSPQRADTLYTPLEDPEEYEIYSRMIILSPVCSCDASNPLKANAMQ
jgi:hypothetical protein